MSYRRQETAIADMQTETLRDLDAQEALFWGKIKGEWKTARADIRLLIINVYHHFFGNNKWDLTTAKNTAAWPTLTGGVQQRLIRFASDTSIVARGAFNTLYRESVLRHAWILDQTTPPSFKVRIPHKLRLFEAGAVKIWAGPNARTQWTERWGALTSAYQDNLMSNLQLGALNHSTALDAADEVDATRLGSPSSGLLDSLRRVFSYETVHALSSAINAVSDVNEEMDVKEIWQTRDNESVCEICQDNEGSSREEADDTIPAHPSCYCYWRLVPKSWADMLANGSPEERRAALHMDSNRLVPSSMVIADEDGNIAGHTVVSFHKWIEGLGLAVGTSQ